LPHGFPQIYPSLINTDPPEHERIRKPANRTLTPGQVNRRLEQIEGISRNLIDGFRAEGTVDIIDRYAIPLPVIVIATILGVEPSDQYAFQKWSNDAFLMSNPTLGDEEFLNCSRGMAELKEYLEAKLEDRRQNPQDDLLSMLVHDESVRLSNEEII